MSNDPNISSSPGAPVETPFDKDASGRSVRIDDNNMKSSYCNVCNVTSTREEVVLNFGLNQTWDRGADGLEIELHHRIIMSPYGIKRLYAMIGDLLEAHEKKYGRLAAED